MAHWLVPPADASDDDPKPEGIIWEEHVWGDSGIELQDAFVLMLEPEDLKVLTGASRWLDIKSVSICALEVHGGLTKHNQIQACILTGMDFSRIASQLH
ncbi:hypothetical protein WG66_005178 [Moniliophthora roreri]|nr:hypothetical protein WG66_005178 [Moniliophthora roreri]